jgi:hypothetical protein
MRRLRKEIQGLGDHRIFVKHEADFALLFIITFAGSLDGFLRGEIPTLQVVSNGAGIPELNRSRHSTSWAV